MPQHIHSRLVEHPNQQRERMNRHEENHQRNNAHFYNSFYRVKRKSRPGCRVGAVVMNFVHVAVNLFPMHETVGEIEISIVNNDKRDNRKHKIRQAVRLKVEIHLCIALFAKDKERGAYNRKNTYREKRIHHLVHNALILRKLLLNFKPEPLALFPDIEKEEKRTRKRQIAQREHTKASYIF